MPLPGMSGIELADRIRKTWPKLPIVLATGYADLPHGADGGMPRLDKPYRLDKLSSAIAMAVGSRAGRSAVGRGNTPATEEPDREVINFG